MNRYLFSKDQQELMENMQVPFAVYQFLDKRVVTLALSDGFCRLFGYKDRFQAYHDMDNDMYKDTHPDDAARIADAAFRFATEGGEYDTIYRTRDHENGGYKVVHAKGTHVHMDNGARLAHVWYTDEGGYNGEPTGQESGLNRALNDALREQSIIQSSYYDYLTGLPSMTYFFQLAEAGKNAIVREGAQAVFLFMDLSGMKFFNTKYSFGAGDELLRSFAKILSRTFGNENCCRIAGDHFAVYTREDGVEDVLRQIFLEARDMNGGNSLPVRVGIYPGRLEDVPVSTACDRAKFACDSLRDTYGSRFSYYDKDLKMDA
jgi:diguanylate cyclase (GGDEF)-like protein